MPIENGYTATKSIRSFEKSSPSDTTSQSSSLSPQRHVPVIAVSASLVERERDFYMDVGFDGWILKPIAFDRLRHIMSGVDDPVARKEDLYKPNGWEKGGWFKEALDDISSPKSNGEAEER
jgi:CheY-like chemotaxis protein